MYPSIEDDDDDLLAALCFDQSDGVEDPYAYIQTDQENMFSDLDSSGVNLQQEQEQVCNIGAQFDSFSGGFVYSNCIGSTQLGLTATYSGVLQQETHQVCSFRKLNEDSGTKEPEQVCNNAVVEINSSSSVGTFKEEQEHVEEEFSRKRGRTGSCSKAGTKACREKMRREKLNDRFMDLSSVLELGRTPKTDKSVILDDAIRVVNQLRGKAHELQEAKHKLLEEIKNLKAEKNEIRKEKFVLKADKEKMEKQLKSMAVQSPGFMTSHQAAFHINKMAVYPSFGYYPNMPMWPYLHPMELDTSHDHLKRPPAA